jgi:hypothetical protein
MTGRIVLGGALALASLLLAGIASAEDVAPPRKRPWPIQSGHNYQPTEQELKDMHQQDLSPDQAREVDRLYEQLLASDEKVRKRRPAPRH